MVFWVFSGSLYSLTYYQKWNVFACSKTREASFLKMRARFIFRDEGYEFLFSICNNQHQQQAMWLQPSTEKLRTPTLMFGFLVLHFVVKVVGHSHTAESIRYLVSNFDSNFLISIHFQWRLKYGYRCEKCQFIFLCKPFPFVATMSLGSLHHFFLD